MNNPNPRPESSGIELTQKGEAFARQEEPRRRREDPPARLRRLRAEAAAEVERLLEFLDITDGDCDLEATGDGEPCLGSIDAEQDQQSWGRSCDSDCEFDPAENGLADFGALDLFNQEMRIADRFFRERELTKAAGQARHMIKNFELTMVGREVA